LVGRRKKVAKNVRTQHKLVGEQLSVRFSEAVEMLSDATEEILSFTRFPKAV